MPMRNASNRRGAEDDASASQAIERILRAGGFTSVTFASAEVALDSDVATTASCPRHDIHLPGMSGFDLYRRLAMVDEQEAPKATHHAHDEPGSFAKRRREWSLRISSQALSGRAFLLDAVTQAMTADDHFLVCFEDRTVHWQEVAGRVLRQPSGWSSPRWWRGQTSPPNRTCRSISASGWSGVVSGSPV